MIRVQEQAFDMAAEIAAMRGKRVDIGAIVTFTGTVRELAAGGKITDMTLEHYPGMTERELERIEAEAHQRWPLIASTVIHRVGRLELGADIVLVITASAHRHAAFEAAQFIMDFLKTNAPFWKKEALTDGDALWVDARDSDDAAMDRWADDRTPDGD